MSATTAVRFNPSNRIRGILNTSRPQPPPPLDLTSIGNKLSSTEVTTPGGSRKYLDLTPKSPKPYRSIFGDEDKEKMKMLLENGGPFVARSSHTIAGYPSSSDYRLHSSSDDDDDDDDDDEDEDDEEKALEKEYMAFELAKQRGESLPRISPSKKLILKQRQKFYQDVLDGDDGKYVTLGGYSSVGSSPGGWQRKSIVPPRSAVYRSSDSLPSTPLTPTRLRKPITTEEVWRSTTSLHTLSSSNTKSSNTFTAGARGGSRGISRSTGNLVTVLGMPTPDSHGHTPDSHGPTPGSHGPIPGCHDTVRVREKHTTYIPLSPYAIPGRLYTKGHALSSRYLETDVDSGAQHDVSVVMETDLDAVAKEQRCRSMDMLADVGLSTTSPSTSTRYLLGKSVDNLLHQPHISCEVTVPENELRKVSNELQSNRFNKSLEKLSLPTWYSRPAGQVTSKPSDNKLTWSVSPSVDQPDQIKTTTTMINTRITPASHLAKLKASMISTSSPSSPTASESSPTASTSSPTALTSSASPSSMSSQHSLRQFKGVEDLSNGGLYDRAVTQTPLIYKTTPQIHQTTPQIHQTTPQIHQTTPQIHQTTHQIHQTTPRIYETKPQIHQTNGDSLLLRCNNPRCWLSLDHACYSGCSRCYARYCGESCRSDDADRHVEQCDRAKMTRTCEEILSEAMESDQVQERLSQIARVGYSCQGRGYVLAVVTSGHEDIRTLEERKLEYCNADDLWIPGDTSDQLQNLIEACQEYEPSEEYIFMVTVSCEADVVQRFHTLPLTAPLPPSSSTSFQPGPLVRHSRKSLEPIEESPLKYTTSNNLQNQPNHINHQPNNIHHQSNHIHHQSNHINNQQNHINHQSNHSHQQPKHNHHQLNRNHQPAKLNHHPQDNFEYTINPVYSEHITNPHHTDITNRHHHDTTNDDGDLILSASPHTQKEQGDRLARQRCLFSILQCLSRRGVQLQKHYPDVHRTLLTYVDRGEVFQPITIYPVQPTNGKRFMCLITCPASAVQLARVPMETAF